MDKTINQIKLFQIVYTGTKEEIISRHNSQVANEKAIAEDRKEVIEKITEYKNEKMLIGYGLVPEWVYDAVKQKIVIPMQAEITRLKALNAFKK